MKLFSFLKKDKAPKRFAIIDVGDADFKQQVIRRSYKTPVLVDFWASWCAPCRQLGPVLERLAEDPDSDFILAKLDTEHNKRTAVQYQIRSIPAVKLFRNGQVVDEFTGALPGALVKRFMKKATDAPPPPPKIRGSATPDQRLKQAAQHLKKGRGFEAFVLLNDFPESELTEKAAQILPLARFLFDVEDGDGVTGIAALDEAYEGAAQAMKQRKPAQALDRLFAALDAGEEMDRTYTTGLIQSVLALLGENNPLTAQYREQLAG